MLITAWPPYRSRYSWPSASHNVEPCPRTGSMFHLLYTLNKSIIHILNRFLDFARNDNLLSFRPRPKAARRNLEGRGFQAEAGGFREGEQEVHVLDSLAGGAFEEIVDDGGDDELAVVQFQGD